MTHSKAAPVLEPLQAPASLRKHGFRLVPYETLATSFAEIADRCVTDRRLSRRNSLVTEFQIANAANDAAAMDEIQNILLMAKLVLVATGTKLRVQARLIRPGKPALFCDDHHACESTAWKVHCALAHRDNLKPELLIRSDAHLEFPPFSGHIVKRDERLDGLRFYLSRNRQLRESKP